jgi:hypothetical protein
MRRESARVSTYDLCGAESKREIETLALVFSRIR